MTFRLDDDAIEQCVRICDQMLAMLREAQSEASHLDQLTGLGDFATGRQLTAGYVAKAAVVRTRIGQYEQVIAAMREAFAAGGEAFADVDGRIARTLGVVEGRVGMG